MSKRPRTIVALFALWLTAAAFAGDDSMARPWSALDQGAVAALVDGAGTVALAELQAERARLAAVAAGAVVSGTIRTGADASWRAADAGPTSPAGWDANLGAVTLSTQWYVAPAGPAHDAAQRAARSYELALAALSHARRDALLDALDRIVALERWSAQEALAAARVDLASRARDVIAAQVAAGTASPASLAEAELTLFQAEGDLLSVRQDVEAARRAFERAFGASVDLVWRPPGDPLAALASATAALTLAATASVSAAEFEAAISASSRVAEAMRALDDASVALERARREAGISVSVSARLVNTGDAGRLTLGAGWDTRSLQPSAELSYDPWNPTASQTTATFGANLSWSFGGSSATAVAQAEIDQALALERLQQAWSAAALELENLARAADQAARSQAVAVERHAARLANLASVSVRAELGAVSALDLRRAELDALDAALALLRADDQARTALLRLELALGRAASFDPIAAALTAAPTEVR